VEARGSDPPRVPNETEIARMMENVSAMQRSLEEIRLIVHQSRLHTERARDMAAEPGMRNPMEGEDRSMYNEGLKAVQSPHQLPHPHHPLQQQSAYPVTEVKKRRGVSLEPPSPSVAPRFADPRRKRVAPPGRCHSCNRVDTPEWRRGPDGARTLCNACGLHYAKLERKKQGERALRPKPPHEG
jgi:hypothetical protein